MFKKWQSSVYCYKVHKFLSLDVYIYPTQLICHWSFSTGGCSQLQASPRGWCTKIWTYSSGYSSGECSPPSWDTYLPASSNTSEPCNCTVNYGTYNIVLSATIQYCSNSLKHKFLHLATSKFRHWSTAIILADVAELYLRLLAFLVRSVSLVAWAVNYSSCVEAVSCFRRSCKYKRDHDLTVGASKFLTRSAYKSSEVVE